MNTIILDILKKFFSSSFKSLLTVALAALGAAAGVPAPTDQASAFIWGLVLVAIRAAISAIGQLIPKIPDIIAAAQAASKSAAPPK